MSADDSKRYYWLKLKQDFFEQDTIDFLMSQKNGSDYVVLYQMLCVKTMNNDGILANSLNEVIIPYDVHKIARDTKYFSEDTIMVALSLYKKIGLVFEQEDGVMRLVGMSGMVGSAVNNDHALRQARYRQRQKEKMLSVTKSDAMCDKVTSQNSDERLEIEIRDRDRDKEIYKESDDFVFDEQKPKETFVSKIDKFTDNEELRSALRDFVEMRKKSKGAFTLRAMDLALNTLTKITTDEETQITVVNRTIENGWKSFFPLGGNNRNKKETLEEKTMRLQREMEEEGYL